VGLGVIDRIFDKDEIQRRTLISAIENEELLNNAIAESERVVGGFDHPNSGLLVVLPVIQSRGLKKVEPSRKPEKPLPAVRPDWIVRRDTRIEELTAIMGLEPTIVHANTPLDKVAKAMLTHPKVHVACVVSQNMRLIGLLKLRALADDLFFHIVPEEFLSEITDIEHAMSFAKRSQMRTAADAMQEPVWVKYGETVMDAFKRMHENDLPGVPVVNDQYQVVGYINLLDLMTVFLEKREDSGDIETWR
jgi:CBS domain-containing protein